MDMKLNASLPTATGLPHTRAEPDMNPALRGPVELTMPGMSSAEKACRHETLCKSLGFNAMNGGLPGL